MYAIPVNGWDIKALGPSQTGTPPDRFDAVHGQSRSALTIGLAVGIPLSVIGIVFFLLSIWIKSKKRRSQNDPKVVEDSEPIEDAATHVRDNQQCSSIQPPHIESSQTQFSHKQPTQVPPFEASGERDPAEIGSSLVEGNRV
jgi:hypothetical protein